MSVAARTAVFACFSALVALANWPALRGLFELSLKDSTASHLAFIPLVTVALIVSNKSVFSVVRLAPVAGLGVSLAGLTLTWGPTILQASASQTNTLTWRIAAVVVMWIGGFLFLYGREAFRAALFPLLFLSFMIPIPGALIDGATQFLKAGTTETIAWLFSLTGTPYYRQAFVFQLPSVTIEVADECSGIRSSIGLVLTSLLAGYTSLASPWRRALLVIAVVPVTILKNGVRIVTLSLLSIHVDPSFLEGRLHHDGGIVFFLLALVLLYPLYVLLRNSEARLQVQAS